MDYDRLLKYLRTNIDYITVAAASLAAYINSLGGRFVWDDKFLIVNNPHIRETSGLTYWFTHLYMSTEQKVTSCFYRPLPGLSFSIDARVWGTEQPFGFHLTNVLIFIATALLFYLLVRRITQNRTVSLVAALIFAVHPVHTEVVAWVSGRTDLLCGFFLLLTIRLFMDWRLTGSSTLRIGSAAVLALALLSKEVALLVVPFLFIVTYWQESPEKRARLLSRIRSVAPHLIVTAIFLAARQFIIAGAAAVESSVVYEPAPLAERLMGAPINVFRYLGMIFIPEPADPYYSATTISSFTNSSFLLSLAGLLAVLAIIFCLRRRSPAAFWSAVWFVIALLPALNIVQLPGTTMAERFVYIPSFGAILILSMALVWVWRRAMERTGTASVVVGAVLLVFLLGFLMFTTWRGNGVWAEELTVWKSVVNKHPNVAYAHNGLGMAYKEKVLEQEAVEEFRIALKLQSDYAVAHLNLASALAEQGDLDEAEVQFKEAIKDDPKITPAYLGLAQVYQLLDPPKVEQAITVLEQGTAALPENPKLALTLSELYVQQNHSLSKAVELLRGIIKKYPDSDLARLALGRAYVKLGKLSEAEKQFRWLELHSEALRSMAMDEIEQLE